MECCDNNPNSQILQTERKAETAQARSHNKEIFVLEHVQRDKTNYYKC